MARNMEHPVKNELSINCLQTITSCKTSIFIFKLCSLSFYFLVSNGKKRIESWFFKEIIAFIQISVKKNILIESDNFLILTILLLLPYYNALSSFYEHGTGDCPSLWLVAYQGQEAQSLHSYLMSFLMQYKNFCHHVEWSLKYTDCILCQISQIKGYPGDDSKLSDGEAPVLKIWGKWSTHSLPLLSGLLWPGVVVLVTISSMSQIDLF